jgi:DNA polymerase type B, organellar and viral.
MRKPDVYVADFETLNSDNSLVEGVTYVWLWDICKLNTLEHTTGTTLDTFIEYLERIAPATVYTHNLKFDGSFLIDYLLKHGYVHTKNRKLENNEFSTLITETKIFYSIKVCLPAPDKKAKKLVEFRDSSKKLKGGVRDIAISYKLPILKGEIDYRLDRPVGYIPTKEEIAYIHNDTEIVARALEYQYQIGMTALTTASDTLNLYKELAGPAFKMLFPSVSIETDNFIRASYRGGVVMVGYNYKEKLIQEPVNVYDVNSMYPAMMADKPLPYGYPEYYKGNYEPDKVRPLYIQHVQVCLDLKEGYYPTILMSNLKWCKLEYITTTNGEMFDLYLTSVDMQLMFEHYNVSDIKYIDGYKFMSSTTLFKAYIIPEYKKKCTTSGSEKETCKLKLNGLYGKFATNPKHMQKVPYLEDGIVKYATGGVEIDKPVYTAVSAFITAYARKYLFDTIQDNFDNFVYCDTDSVHLTCEIKNAEVHPKKLGAFKLEKTFVLSKYLAQKTYYGITEEGEKYIKIAGCPSNVKEAITLDDFYFGRSFTGKLLPKTVNGGVILKETDFTLKPR